MSKFVSSLIVKIAFFVLVPAAAFATELKDLPKEIAVPGASVVASVQATGAQIYACSKNAKGSLEWTFREPVASLFQDGKTIGRHFFGPTWEFSEFDLCRWQGHRQGAWQDRKGCSLAKARRRRTREGRPRRRRHRDFANRHQGWRFRGRLRARGRTSRRALCGDLCVCEIVRRS